MVTLVSFVLTTLVKKLQIKDIVSVVPHNACTVRAQLKRQRVKEQIGTGISILIIVISLLCLRLFVSNSYALTKKGVRILGNAILTSLCLKIFLLPLLRSIIIGRILWKARHADAFDRLLCLRPKLLFFSHVAFPGDLTQQAAAYVREVTVNTTTEGLELQSSGTLPRTSPTDEANAVNTTIEGLELQGSYLEMMPPTSSPTDNVGMTFCPHANNITNAVAPIPLPLDASAP